MHHKQIALGAAMGNEHGWQRPARFTTPEEEAERVRGGVGLCDVSPAGKLYLLGDEIDSALASAFPGLGAQEVGAVSLQPPATPDTSGDVLLARLAGDEVLAVTPTNQAPSTAEALSEMSGGCVHAVDVTSALAGVSIAGPLAHRLLAALTELDVSPEAFLALRCAQTMVAEVHGTLVRRDLGGLPRFDLYFGRELGEYMWDALVEAGREHGLVPFGLEALALLRRGRD